MEHKCKEILLHANTQTDNISLFNKLQLMTNSADQYTKFTVEPKEVILQILKILNTDYSNNGFEDTIQAKVKMNDMETIMLIQSTEKLENGYVIQDSFELTKWDDDDHIVVIIPEDNDQCDDEDDESSSEISTTSNHSVQTENNSLLINASSQTVKGQINTTLCKFYNGPNGCHKHKCTFTHLKSKTPNWNDIECNDNLSS